MNQNESPHFLAYVLPGDSTTWEKNGFIIKATIMYDDVADPRNNKEAYLDADIERWLKDDWFFCGVVLSVSYMGLELHDSSASLWGIECNITDDNTHLDSIVKELEDEAVSAAIDKLHRIRELLDNYPVGKNNA